MSILGAFLGLRPKYGAKLAMTLTSGMWLKSALVVVIDIRYVDKYQVHMCLAVDWRDKRIYSRTWPFSTIFAYCSY